MLCVAGRLIIMIVSISRKSRERLRHIAASEHGYQTAFAEALTIVMQHHQDAQPNTSQVDIAVKAHSLAEVFVVCQTIVEFLQKELVSEPQELCALGESVSLLRSSPMVFARRGVQLEKSGYRSRSVFRAEPATPAREQALSVGNSPAGAKELKRVRYSNGTRLVKLECSTECDPVIEQLREKKIRDQELRTMEIVQKFNMNQGYDQRHRNISLNKSRKVLEAERKWLQQAGRARVSDFQSRAKQTKSSLEDLPFLKRSNDVEFRVLEESPRVLGLPNHLPLENQRCWENRANRNSPQQTITKREPTLRETYREADVREATELKDTSLHVIGNSTSKKPGNWINVSTYWKDHMDVIINAEEHRPNNSPRQTTSILKDEVAWMNTGPLASLMTSTRLENKSSGQGPQHALTHLRPSQPSVLGTSTGNGSRPKKGAPFLLKKVRMDKRVNW